MSDFECTLWLDGWPPPFGSGDEWLHCCVGHDLGGSLVELVWCVANSPGGWLMAVVMGVGVAIGYPWYRRIKAARSR